MGGRTQLGSTWVRGQGVKDQVRVGGGGLIDSRSMLKMMGGGWRTRVWEGPGAAPMYVGQAAGQDCISCVRS